ncbi:MAG TPA: MFS transporter [Candidatus Acidoferrum sp.]|jgi:MFS family permease|nr:MFS transporter [Candidatus Acidoferrum sp.]
MPETSSQVAPSRAAFTYPNFAGFQLARFFVVLTTEMQSVAVGWQVYEITKQPLDLGLVGLAQFLPAILLFLVSGHAADRLDRRKLLLACYAGYAACSLLFFSVTLRDPATAAPLYAILVLLGVVRAFSAPVSRAILPQIVPEEHFASAVAWGSSIFQVATILGPALGGIVYAAARGPAAVYALGAACAVTAAIMIARMRLDARAPAREPTTMRTVLAGLRYIWQERLILGAISLDLFAVLLGGAVALLPVYAREILHTGPWGLGLLRSAPGIGAGCMALVLAHKQMRRAGKKMLWCVAGFGLFTVLFGVSRSFVASMIALFFVGALDMVSVIVRAVLIQLWTPDAMRGRVNAVDMIFIGASNELGEFESGVTAHWLGTIPAVVLGGVAAMAVTAIWAWRFPELRDADRLTLSE